MDRGTRIGAGLSTEPDTENAFTTSARAAHDQLGNGDVDLAVVFASRAHLDEIDAALATVGELLQPGNLIGCCAQGVVGAGHEVEEGAGATVWAASLPDARVEGFHLLASPLEDGMAIEGVPEEIMRDESGPDMALLLSDPYTFPADALLDVLSEERPGMPVVGGIASGAQEIGDPVLFYGQQAVGQGAVGVLLEGVDVLPCVSQGAAPIGPEMVVTAAEGNLIAELASKPALEKLNEVIAEIDSRSRALAASGLLIGVVIDENQPTYERGDFLIRGLLGADRSSGALAVGDLVRVGQTVRFHVRDAESADTDLREALALQNEALGSRGTAGALLFTCNGRGSNMFSVADHDAGALAESLGAPPVSGFFCAGEIGPVGGRNFLHGFTATMALFAADR
jgi:small ligand-binding sensory domain FIST